MMTVTRAAPKVHRGREDGFLCSCKQTGIAPYCDGTYVTPLVQDQKKNDLTAI